MKKLQVFGVSLFFLICMFSLVSAVRINEVELNPEGTDSGNEWIEFYSEEEINFTNLKLIDGDGNEFLFNLSFQGFFVYNFLTRWLDNDNNQDSLNFDIYPNHFNSQTKITLNIPYPSEVKLDIYIACTFS